jgi:glyoxylate reductase
LSADGDVSPEELLGAVQEADGLVCMLTDRIGRELFERAPRLRVVGNCAVGVDNVDVVAATELGVQVCNTPNVLTEATADLTWALLLAMARRIPEADRYVRQGRFQRWQLGLFLGRRLDGATLGIVGFGRIGRAVARRARGFGLRVLYTQRRRAPEDVERDLRAHHVSKSVLLAGSDFISLHLPLTGETRHYLDRSAISELRPTAIVVNTSRGAIIDEAALAEALAAGRIAGAGLDVFEEEPQVHPALLTLDNVVLAPHIGSATQETRAAMAEAVARDVARVLRGERPENGVNQPKPRTFTAS